MNDDNDDVKQIFSDAQKKRGMKYPEREDEENGWVALGRKILEKGE